MGNFISDTVGSVFNPVGSLFGAFKKPNSIDPYDLANADSQSSINAARVNAGLNRVDTYSPFGSQTFTNLGNDRWRTDLTLNPWEQSALDTKRRIGSDLGGFAEENLGQRYDLSGVPKMPGTGDFSADRDALTNAVYGQYTRFLDPQMNRREDSLKTDLANRGIMEGSDAYKNSMFDFNANKANVYGDIMDRAVRTGADEQSRLFGLGMQAHNQGIGDYERGRYAPLREMGMVNQGVDVNMPGMTQAAPVNVSAPPIGQYMMDKYNVGMGSYNNMLGGLFGLGGAAIKYM